MISALLTPHASVWYALKWMFPASSFDYKLIAECLFFLLHFISILLQVCKNYTRAYIHCLVTKDAMGSQLLSYHNLYYMMKVWTLLYNESLGSVVLSKI